VLQKSTVAAILQNSNAELILDEISLPEQLFHGQVLVELISSGICGAQINEIDAVKGPDRFLPHLLGHEGYAKVLEIGGGVSTVASGDYVVMHWRPGSGIEAKPAKYEWRGKNLNSGWVTTFNRHSVVSENRITKIEPGILQKEIIPLMGCALTTALGVLEKEAKANFRDILLILGAGGVGLTLVKVAKFLGVSNIVIVDTDKSKIIKAKEIGATNGVVFQNKEQVLAELKQLYPYSLPSIAIDTSGQPSAIEICYEASAANARVVLVGVPKLGSNVNIYTLPLHFGKSIMGSKGGGSNPDVDIPILIDLILTKKLDFSDFPTSTYGFNDVNQAIRDLRSGLVGRVIVDFDK
jgi:Zn-dependent alcohol dehydrogenase